MEFGGIDAVWVYDDSVGRDSKVQEIPTFCGGDDDDQIGAALIDSLESL
jgi:hypothetical protein